MTDLIELFPEDWIPPSNYLDGYNREDCKGVSLPYLDHGFVQLVDFMGSDMSIVDGARTSFRSSSEEYTERQNRNLINYLMEHKHSSPFELPVVMFRIRVPLFVRAQHVRHRTQSCNWESHRYQEPTGEFYVPPLKRYRRQDVWNKQGSGERLSEDEALALISQYEERGNRAWSEYREMIDMGLSRETARECLPTNFYCSGVFSMNLRNALHYLKLRGDAHAQPEIRALAYNMELFIKKLFPMAYDAWVAFDRDATTFSDLETSVLQTSILEDKDGFYTAAEESIRLYNNHAEGTEVPVSKRKRRSFFQKVFGKEQGEK